MDWQKGERSRNVEVDSGRGGGGGFGFGGGRGLGIGGLIVLAILGWVFFKDPTALLDQGGTAGPTAPVSEPAQVDPQQRDFVSAILGSTEKTWGDIFAAGGRQYTDPRLDLFSGGVRTACGLASTAVGPFYCPGDEKVYLDLSFFRELQDRFGAAGDFARAYVIAHEVGHHVQKLLGVFDRVQQARERGAPMEGANGLSVRQELQADCFAGVWANRSEQRLHWLEAGDVEEALNAASQIGDDTLQRESRGAVVPDSFTHGTSAQRVKWFKTGLESGKVSSCDTFSGDI
ncbi:MAG TPA: neutral zinc metallopeptidase [Frateuria sp.]|uniref:KPN_02809 family neutral zinc metallopeptidase n=1 Tax=Frateuria sp. TaxID=2211372 RepID=UPI002D7E2EA6|nr:neutral zinc metallopeptidase [Frateuria sp.]HET6805466.1 neutral zinc metallopeptidase [Frateuria sp.]